MQKWRNYAIFRDLCSWAPSSGSGKTMLTCGILQALKNRGCAPASYKCGPDYIDPMFHSRVLGTPSRNLDTFFTGKTTRYLFANSAKHAGISVMEGVMGLYDGVGGITDQASAYDLARVTDTPVILIVNAKGMSLSLIPFLKGFVDYQRADGRVIQGVILNRATKMTSMLLKEKIEQETGLKLIGYVPELTACRVESRHLGLVTPGEIQDLQTRMEELAGELEKSLDFEALLAIAEHARDYLDEAGDIPAEARYCRIREGKRAISELLHQNAAGLFASPLQRRSFLLLLSGQPGAAKAARGRELVYFSPVHDRVMPDGCSGSSARRRLSVMQRR